ncbi:MAG: TadE family protein [Actinomycetota bacterium]
MGRSGGGERGDVATTVIVFPAVLALFYVCVHAAMVYHADQAVNAAAQDALYWAQLEDGTEADGESAAIRILDLAAGLRNATVVVSQTDDAVTVTVTAEVETVAIDAFDTVSATISGPRERFYHEDERR